MYTVLCVNFVFVLITHLLDKMLMNFRNEIVFNGFYFLSDACNLLIENFSQIILVECWASKLMDD